MTIVEFLLARIEEDAAAARAASDRYDQWDAVGSSDGEVAQVVGITGIIALRPGLPTAQHIARNDPARVLAECAAKKQILDDYAPYCVGSDLCGGHDDRHTVEQCGLRRVMASVYADHPHFDPAWLA